MMNHLYPAPSELLWRELYRVALFQPNPGRLSEDIERAESAIVLRARQLFTEPGDNVEEKQALDDAMYALQALKSCVQSRACSVQSA